MQPDRSIATILFTDIVGSTERAAELGDRDWGDVLEQHHTIVREILNRWGGREVSETGDGFLSVFENPAHAILCAVAIRESVRDLDLEVRCGAHLGEVERKANHSVGGIAVHIAARVAAAAGAGEVFVTSTVRDTESGSGFGFEDRGRYELKGVPRRWRLFAITGVPDVAEPTWQRSRWRERLRHPVAIGAIALAALVVVAGSYVVIQDRGKRFSPAPAMAEAAPGIAVLPFTVQGEGLDLWREGMVDLLSTGLDGAAGLRTINSRTVLARWHEHVSRTKTADLATVLQVANKTGASYAVVGSIVSIGPDVRLVADIYDLGSGERLGQGRVEGAPDSVLMLVDRLAVEVLSVILGKGEGDLPEVNLARLTSGSAAALRAYLEGEVLFRRGEFDEAARAYERAVAADSTFALALYRLSFAYSWTESFPPGSALTLERAVRFADRLPEREAILVRAHLAIERGTLDGVEPLLQATRRFPDDPEAWYLLGETYLHLGWQALSHPEQAAGSFTRATELDPKFGPAYIHRVDTAFLLEPDSTRVADLIHAYDQLAPGSRGAARFRLGLRLAFGDSVAYSTAIAALDTTTVDLGFMALSMLYHPRFLNAQEAVLGAALDRAEPGEDVALETRLLFGNQFSRGRLGAAVETLERPGLSDAFRTTGIFAIHNRGLPIPFQTLEQRLAIGVADSSDPIQAFYTGAYALARGRPGDSATAMRWLRNGARHLFASRDSTSARFTEGMAQALEGYAAWHRGEREHALSLLQSAQLRSTGASYGGGTGVNEVIRWWLAELLLESGRPREAARYFRSIWSAASGGPSMTGDSWAHYRLGKLYEDLEDHDKALKSYEYFVEQWKDADPELQSMVEEARQAIIRLKGLRRE